MTLAQIGQNTGTLRRTGQLPKIFADLLSIEACFVLFIFSGRYKALPELQFLPIDPTLLFLVLTGGLIAWRCSTRHLKALPMEAADLLMLAFSAYAIISVFWSSLEPKNIDKVWRFALIGASGYFFVRMLAQDQERLDRIVRLIVAFSAALLMYYAFHRWIVGIDIAELQFTGRIRGNNYLEYGAHASYLFLACLALTVFGPRRWLPAGIFGAISSLFILTLVGARGAFVMSMLGIPMIAVLVMGRRNSMKGIGKLLLFLAVLAGAAWAGYLVLITLTGFRGAEEQLYTLERLSLHLSHEATRSLDLRSDGRDLAFRRWLELPLFGWGMGEFRLQHSLDYPHNLLLEVLMELGLAGAILYVPVQLIAVFACIRAARSPDATWIDMAIVLIFFTELVSHATVQGYLGEGRIYFALVALAISLGRRKTQGTANWGQVRRFHTYPR